MRTIQVGKVKVQLREEKEIVSVTQGGVTLDVTLFDYTTGKDLAQLFDIIDKVNGKEKRKKFFSGDCCRTTGSQPGDLNELVRGAAEGGTLVNLLADLKHHAVAPAYSFQISSLGSSNPVSESLEKGQIQPGSIITDIVERMIPKGAIALLLDEKTVVVTTGAAVKKENGEISYGQFSKTDKVSELCFGDWENVPEQFRSFGEEAIRCLKPYLRKTKEMTAPKLDCNELMAKIEEINPEISVRGTKEVVKAVQIINDDNAKAIGENDKAIEKNAGKTPAEFKSPIS